MCSYSYQACALYIVSNQQIIVKTRISVALTNYEDPAPTISNTISVRTFNMKRQCIATEELHGGYATIRPRLS